MNHYQLNMIEYLKYAVTHEGKLIGTINIDDKSVSPMFHYVSKDGTVKGSVPEVKDAVRALRAWHISS